jgi:hypothetical protein
MDHLKYTSILESENKTFIHLNSSTSYNAKEKNATQGIVYDLIKNRGFGGIHFEIESINKQDLLNPVIPVHVTDDLGQIYRDTFVSFAAPSRIGVLISSIDRPFLSYKSLILFPHDMVRFNYMIIYHGWGQYKEKRHPFLDVFNKYNYLLEFENDDVYVVKSSG